MYRLLAAMTLLVATCASVAAQDWPTRTVTLVVPFAAGGPADVIARILTPHMSERLGRQVIVENVGGAGGMTGTARVARAAPDGYQFVIGDNGTLAANQTLYKHPLYDAAKDFAPVALVVEQPFVLIARKDLPVRSLPDFIAYTRQNQEKMQYGSGGVGSPAHLVCLLLNAAIGVNVTHVAYRGAAPAMQDLIAGRIDYQCVGAALAIPQIATGAVTPLATLARARSRALPELASAGEQGLGDFEAGVWNAFFLPKATPAAIVQKLHDATIAAVEMPAVQERLQQIAAEVVAPDRRSPQYLQNFVASEVKKWGQAINAAGLSLD